MDSLFGFPALHQVYSAVKRTTRPGYGAVALGHGARDGGQHESADIVRMFGDAFGGLAPSAPDLYPEDLRPAIDDWNDRIHPKLNNGVYRAGFATPQAAYDEAVGEVFETWTR